MTGREQKACEDKWNSGFASYACKLVNSELIIRVIYDCYIQPHEGAKLIAFIDLYPKIPTTPSPCPDK